MENYVDLHIHSTFSDGALSQSEIISNAKKLGLKAISITDHDTASGYFNFNTKYSDIEILKGVEIITTANGCPVEVLCYGFDEKDMEMFIKTYSLSHAEESKVKADKEIDVLKNYGIDINLDTKNYDYSNPKNWIINELWALIMKNEKAYNMLINDNPELAKSAKNFFRKGMSCKTSKFFVDLSNDYISLKKISQYCNENKLICILAHPGEYYSNLDIVLDYAKDYVDGIETYHPSVNKELKSYLQDFCKKYNLLESGGSDFHGYRGELNSEKVPYQIYEKLKQKLNSKKNN